MSQNQIGCQKVHRRAKKRKGPFFVFGVGREGLGNRKAGGRGGKMSCNLSCYM